MTNTFEIQIDGDFRLAASAEFFRGFRPTTGGAVGEGTRLALGFLADGSFEPLRVELEQRSGALRGTITGDAPAAAVRAQVARMLSLDVDVAGWAAVLRRDPVVDGLQARFPGFRPVCFPSPYEAAVWGIIAHRISMVQASALKARLAREHGTVFRVGEEDVVVVPAPARVLEVTAFAGLAAEKLTRLHGIAEAALAGRLDAERLRAMPEDQALAELSTLRGVGPWTAAHILYRGAALADALAGGEPRVLRAAKIAYGLRSDPSPAKLAQMAEGWRPYRMWVAILLARSIAGTEAWNARGDGEARGRGGSSRPKERM